MRICKACNQVYNDDSFFFCLTDGSRLSDITPSEETLVLPSMASIVTVIARGDSLVNSDFQRKFVYDDTATDDLLLKIISSGEDDLELGLKITVENLATDLRTVYVSLKALDSDGFEVENVTLGGAKLRPGEIRTFTQKERYDHDTFQKISQWSVEEVSSYEE